MKRTEWGVRRAVSWLALAVTTVALLGATHPAEAQKPQDVYRQSVQIVPAPPPPPPPKAQKPEDVYRRSVHGVVWIVNKTGWLWRSEVQGAGFLVDKKRQMIATCDHVVKGSSRLEVYFPFRDAQDRLVAGRDSYKGNETLRKQGYMTAARVLASNTEKDLAILEVDTVPKDAVELALANKDPQKNDRLHIIWHPAERPLWRYCPGIEPEVTRYRPQGGQAGVNFQAILYRSGIFPGGDGSPALNEEGKVVGVNARGGGEGNIFAIAVHWSEIANLLNQQQRGKVR